MIRSPQRTQQRVLLMIVLVLTSVGLLWAATPPGVNVGDPAPPFRVKNIDGRLIGVEDAAGKGGLILIFTCNHCPYSKAYEDRIIALHQAYAVKGWPVLAVNPNDPEKVPEDSFDEMKVRATEKGFPFLYAADETQEVARSYGATRTPHVFLLQKAETGFIVAYIGAIDDNARDADKVETRFVEDAINTMMKGNQPNPSFTKAIGCTIKWRD